MNDKKPANNEDSEKSAVEAKVGSANVEKFHSISRQSMKFLKESEGLFASHWDARADLIKSIVSVASGALVLTVTFSNLLIGQDVSSRWKYVLLGSWASFLSSIMFAMVSFWLLGEVRAFPTIIISESNRVIRALDPENGQNEVGDVASILSGAVIKKMRFDKRSKKMLGASLVAFIIALVLLGLLGFKRLTA